MYYTYFPLLEYSDTNWNMPGCPFWYTVIPPCILLSSSGYEAVQGGTRQWNWYNEVQGSTRKSRTPGYAGTRKYMKVQGLVPPCTSISRGTGLSGTALYRLVPPRIQKRTRRYEKTPEFRKYASMYQYIRVHPSSYWLIQVIESMSWFILLRRRKLPWLVCINTNQIHLGMYKDKPGTSKIIDVHDVRIRTKIIDVHDVRIRTKDL